MIHFSKEQLSKLLLHNANTNLILLDAMLQSSQPEREMPESEKTSQADENPDNFLGSLDLNVPDNPEMISESLFIPRVCYDSERIRKEQTLSLLCGRWISGKSQNGIEISRVGEHFILTYLKSNGKPTDERYILIWLDGDILYYGYADRITVLGLDMERDTLMVSPGMDYTRVSEVEKR